MINGVGTSVLERNSLFYNLGQPRQSDAGGLDIHLTARFENLASGTYDLETNSGIFSSDFGPWFFDNFGTLRKSGPGASAVSAYFNNLGGPVDVQNGTLVLNNNGASSNGVFTVAAGAAVDLTGGQNPTWAGTLHATGAGQIQLNSGTLSTVPSLILDCADGVFRWNGGVISGTATNVNVLTLSGAGDAVVGRHALLANAGLLRHSGTGLLNLQLNAQFENLASGTYDLESDSGVSSSDFGPWFMDNFGTIRKSAGTNTSTINAVFTNYNGSIEVDSGTLNLTGNDFAQGTGSFTVQLGGTNSGQSGLLTAGHVTLSIRCIRQKSLNL